jgi:putative peptidoglycan lipid II flippase
MILVSYDLLNIVYFGGEVKEDDIRRAYWASIFFCLGIWAFEAQMVILRVFFVLKDTKTPTAVSLLMILLNVGLNLTLVWFLQEGGIALATTTAAVVQGVILLTILRRRLGPLGMRALAANVGKSLIAAVVMVQVGWLVAQIPMPWNAGAAAAGGAMDWRAKVLTSVVKLPLLVAACGGVYLGIARFFRMPEVADVPLVGRLFRD